MATELDELAELAVLADDLQQRGDPHGELIATHLAVGRLPAGLRRSILERKFAAILARNHDRLFGALAPYIPCTARPDVREPALVIDTWQHGFADEVTMRTRHLGPPLDEVYRIARTLPIASRMRGLQVAYGYDAAFERALVDDPPPLLRDLLLADHAIPTYRAMDYDDDEEAAPFDFTRLVPVIQRLEVFRVAHRAYLPPLESDTLRSIGVVVQGEGTSFAQSRLPNLERLHVLGRFELGFCARFPALEALALGEDYAVGFLEELLASPMLARLRELDIRLAPDEVELFMQHPERLAHLRRCAIGTPWIPGLDALRAAARAVLPPCVTFG